MLKLNDFLDKYFSDPILHSLIQKNILSKEHQKDIDSTEKIIKIRGVYGSLFSFILYSIIEKYYQNQVIICKNKEEAEYLYSDIDNIFNNKFIKSLSEKSSKPYNFYLYPEIPEKKIYKARQEASSLLARREIIDDLFSNTTNFTVITYPKAILSQIDNIEDFNKNALLLNRNEAIELTDLKIQLLSMGFEKVDTVTTPGEFAIRGGIVDIYSFSKQEPYRIGFFGDEIENIRHFDPSTQLTTQYVDNANISYKSENKEKLRKQSFFKILPSDTLLWIKDKLSLNSVLETNTGENENIEYETLETWKENTQRFIKIFNQNDPIQKGINISSEIQMNYNSNFKILAKELDKLQHNSYQIFIVSQHFKSSEKIKEILNDINKNLKINTLKIGLYQGFIDHDRKIVCFTDHQILGRYYYPKSTKISLPKNSITIKQLNSLNVGDYIAHVDHGIGMFAGMHLLNGKQEVVKLIYKNDDTVFLNIQNLYKIVRYSGKDGKHPPLSKLGSAAWENKKKNIKIK